MIPLIRSNFHVTESNVHRYRLFYYRQDVWRSVAEPALASLKTTMFEEIKIDKAQQILDSRTLGFSQVRLLPKETGVRPIMNLRRRVLKKGFRNILGMSINSVLAPVYNVLTFEKVRSLSIFPMPTNNSRTTIPPSLAQPFSQSVISTKNSKHSNLISPIPQLPLSTSPNSMSQPLSTPSHSTPS